MVKQNNAIAKLNSRKTNAGCNLLNAFTNEVHSLISGGILTAAQGNPLVVQAQTIEATVPC